MSSSTRARIRRSRPATLVGGVAAMLLAAPSVASGVTPADLPECGAFTPARQEGVISRPWQAVLDADGVVTGHRVTIAHGDTVLNVEAGWRAFAVTVADDRLLVGERSTADTRLTLLHVPGSCVAWTRVLSRLAYPAAQTDLPERLRLAIIDPGTRAYAGTLLLDGQTGGTEALIDGDCAATCLPVDGDHPAGGFGPAVAPRPVPSFSGGPWPQRRTLPFRWAAGATPPRWARGPLRAAAEDSDRSSAARSPRFVHQQDAANGIHYGGPMPPFCSGIACASRSVPTGSWGIWLRPHGSDFGWGRLRWCQKSPANGCFDIRRVALHELGHVSGLNHPESAGFRLGAHQTVMHAVSPARPRAGSTRHAFGHCDVATLQELYDVANNRTPISPCNDVESRLTLRAARATVPLGQGVALEAVLQVADKQAYGALAGNPLNGRSVRLKFRRAGSDDPWQAAWMRSTFSSGRYELSINPASAWEFKAVFAAPDDEGLRYSRSDVVRVEVQA